MKKFAFPNTVHGRLLLLALCIETLMLTILVANSQRLLSSAMTNQARWQAEQIAPVLNAALKAPLAQRDYVTVQAVLDESHATDQINYIAVADMTGKRIAISGWPVNMPLPAPSDRINLLGMGGEPRYDVVAPISYGGQQLGVLQFGLNLSPIVTARRVLLTQGIGIAIMEIALSSIILVLIGLWLTRHLAQLTRASLQVAAGNLTPEPVPEGKDDIGHLGAAFNAMSKVIAERVNELVRAKEAAEASERAKSASEERLKLVLDGTRDAFWDWDFTHNRVEFSNRWAEILGYTHKELEPYQESWERLVHPDDKPSVLHTLHEHLEGRMPFYEAEYRMRSSSGEWVWILDRGKVVERDETGRPLRCSGTHTDITDRKKIEEALRKNTTMLEDEILVRNDVQAQLAAKQEQLETLNQSLQQRINESVAELRQKDQILISQGRQAAMGEMIGNIAHQWRQPLNALSMVFGNIQSAHRHRELNDEYLAKAGANANRLIQKMSTTITDFRNFFRPDKEIVSFSALKQVNNAVALLEPALAHEQIQVNLDAPSDFVLVGFPNEYSQVLLNLLSNAKDAIKEFKRGTGRIDIRLYDCDGHGCVSVRDDGGGIPEPVLDKIFEPYFSTKKMGSGIGLYMSKMIIERSMNGRIEVYNREGGAEFIIVSPLEGGQS